MFFFIESFDVLHVIRIILLSESIVLIVSCVCILWTYVRFWLCLVDSVMYHMNLHVIQRDLVMSRCCFGYVSFEPPWDYAGFSYASIDSVIYPMNLCEIMRDLVMPRCCLVMVRWVWLCFVCIRCFGYVIIVGYVLCIISMILYYIKDITYDLI